MSRGNHIVACSEDGGDATGGGRHPGCGEGLCCPYPDSVRTVPSSEQKVTHASVNCLLHLGQYFIERFLDEFQLTEEILDLDCGVFV